MSERGSFVTEYIYCPQCFEAAKKVLLGKDKYLCSVAIPTWEKEVPKRNKRLPPHEPELPIIAGKIGGLYAGEEVHAMEEYLRELAPLLCDGHDVTVAVLPDSGDGAFLSTRGIR